MSNTHKPRNIFIIGPQCAGKTTLLEAVKAHFRQQVDSAVSGSSPKMPFIIREVARTVMEESGITRDDIASSQPKALELQKLILKAQLDGEVEAYGSPFTDWYISDRSGVDPIVYAEVHAGVNAREEMLEMTEWDLLKKRMREGVVLLCEAGNRDFLIDDGVRYMPSYEEWEGMNDVFKRLLKSNDIVYHLLSKDFVDMDARLKDVIAILEFYGMGKAS